MPRILAIDYGTRRTGLAVTDPLQIIAQALDTVPTEALFDYLQRYLQAEDVETIVVGWPMHPDGQPAQIAPLVEELVGKLRKTFPAVQVVLQDERYTSEQAKSLILQSGARRKKRRDKALVDRISAAVILEAYMKSAGLWS
ncbi:MAG: putative pre-16S rRNA nuclease [Saprospiraceae bacterium]|nr:MAG: putative pre-16S rRNA nuclease [Saprospiraceae bacterium]